MAITREEIEKIFEEFEDYTGKEKGDRMIKGLNIMREACPLVEVHSIIQGADHDVFYCIDIDEAEKYLNADQVRELARLDFIYDEDNDCISHFA
jgi:hypothetical protein